MWFRIVNRNEEENDWLKEPKENHSGREENGNLIKNTRARELIEVCGPAIKLNAATNLIML